MWRSRWCWETTAFLSRAATTVGAGAVLKISEKDGKWQVSDPPIWENKYLRCKFTSPVLYQDHIYGLDEGIMVCLDAKNGKRLWRGGRYGHGQILLTGDLILVLAEDGKLVLVQATPEEHRELGSIRALQATRPGTTWHWLAASPIYAITKRWLPTSCPWPRRSSRKMDCETQEPRRPWPPGLLHGCLPFARVSFAGWTGRSDTMYQKSIATEANRASEAATY